MKFRSKHAVLSLVIAAAFAGVVASEDVSAQSRGGKKAQKAEQMFPNATRQEPNGKASSKVGKKLQKMIDAYNADDLAQTRVLADEILAADGANEYDRSLAAQLAAQAAYNLDDNAASKAYLKQVLELGGLDNNGHYQSMLMLAQLHLADDELEPGLAVLDQYLSETGSTKPEDLVIKGQALYQAERFQEAIPVLKQAVESSPEPKDSWVQLLMACYAEANQHGEAIALAERLAAKNPNDKKAQTNLASVYAQGDQVEKAAEVLEKLRASGQLTEEREYRQLYVTYANMDGREKDVVAVINEGLEKGILKPDYQTYLALAQSHYFMEQIPQAIENWQKAAPLSKDGETYLNLARVLYQEGRVPEAKQAAQQALAKGVRKPEDARKIINLK
ncbi:Tetratricopeptide TPR_1 repeat-containing protein [Pseudoxanthomonas suwonensis 11-1]|uniref:Tetratricopeptide TPR_1 repeat-containing protein n=1 Tax=Pseudoxanthomonas suwonensis (strain 11-1) TaxID=743721 RepID=E6WNX2_PSEUU|nr:tetratricopeptide repeat protein [Pseudoxanthomonas suwonensis]ADV25871.1 Tetratricopeptide TPR_1 repeat-containing protein [Pseudoxanthomonas suwonensis 11-1]